MALKTKSKGIVLSRSVFGESDMYVHILTKQYGVISALAKAARKSRKRYAGGLDLFCHDEFFFRGNPRSKPYIQELIVLNTFVELRSDLDKAMAAGNCVQWVRKLAKEGSSIPGVYSLLGQTLALIEKEQEASRVDALQLTFRFKLLRQLGLSPQLHTCVNCSKEITPPTSFDVSAGGVSCKACSASLSERIVLGVEGYETFRKLDGIRFGAWEESTFEKGQVKPLLALLAQFATYHVHTRLPN